MEGVIGVSQFEFWALLFGWVLAVLFGLITIACLKVTPAKTFLVAWLRKKQVASITYRTGIREFAVAENNDPGSMDVRGNGSFLLTEGSQSIERSSRVPMYDCFSEYGASIPKEYVPIIQEIKEAGFSIVTFDDYLHLIKLVNDEKYREDFLSKYEGAALKVAKKNVDKLAKLKIDVKPYKSYGLKELADFFPNNISPVYIDAKVTNATNRLVNKMKLNSQFLIYAGIAALLVVTAIVILVKVLPQQQCDPKVIVQTIETGVQLANSTTTSLAA